MSARRYPIGAERVAAGVSFRIWAPDRTEATLVFHDGGEKPLDPEDGGYFSTVAEAPDGALYWFLLDSDERLYPDPASRFQPQGPHGPSQFVDAATFRWSDGNWPGVALKGQVIYEMHVGTFTRPGSWEAAAERLPHLKETGVTLIEMMPVNDFPGRFGWGYDGVNLFAPTRLYGGPDDLRRFIDSAHREGIGVILDVVYNHLGPDGNFLSCFARDYFTDRYANEWGQALNFDGPGAPTVREFFISNAAYWIEEFHFDGLRLDATQSIHDASSRHVLADIALAARQAAGSRAIVLIGENEPQDARLLQPVQQGGAGLDALWNDDFHHSATVAMSGRNEAYYEDHLGHPQEFVSAAKRGFLFQGQFYAHQSKRRGSPTGGHAPEAFVNFIQNHDQIANTAWGARLHATTSPGRARAMTALLLLMPGTPMLFQGQEFAASSPFLYFADHHEELASLVSQGRREFVSQFRSIADDAVQTLLAEPDRPATVEACILDWSEVERNQHVLALHRDLVALRRNDAVFAEQSGDLDGAVLGEEAFVLRFFGASGDDRLLLVNFGRDLVRRSLAEPLVAPPGASCWQLRWSSEHPDYGGSGTPPVETRDGWHLPGHASIVLAAVPAPGAPPAAS